MFKNPPKVIGHISALKHGPFVGQEYIMTKVDDEIRLLNRLCPHRFYPIGDLGYIENITCKLHGFSFNEDGSSKNNPYKLSCHSSNVGKSGIVFRNFSEPDHKWVNDVANEKNLQYSHCYFGKSDGNWLWLMEIEADLWHIRESGVHPWLSSQINPLDVKLENGDGWIYQEHPDGWWVYVFPFIFIEWTKGCLSINCTFPNDIKIETGYSWLTQLYYDPEVTQEKRDIFNKIEDVFREDVLVSEQQKTKYIPYKKSLNVLEDQAVVFGEWVEKNRI